jgi:hypothetical protein
VYINVAENPHFSVQYDRFSDQEVEMNYFVGILVLILAHLLCIDANIQGLINLQSIF